MENLITLDITASGTNGEGIARYNGKVYFVKESACGDRVLARVVKENKSFVRCEIVDIINKSKNRCEPPCKYFEKCGGCSLQFLNYDAQLSSKKDNIISLLKKSKIDAIVEDVEPSELEFGYRNKLTLYLSKNNILSFYEKNSKNLVEINKCLLVDEKFNFFINKFNEFLKNNKQFNFFILKGLSIREIDDIFLINLFLTKKINLDKLQNFFKLNKIKYSLYFCILQNTSSVIPTYPCNFCGGVGEVKINEFGITYPVHPMSFIQVNNLVKNKIYSGVLTEVCGYFSVIDAYSGAGLLSAMLASKNREVFAIEIDESAARACNELCKTNHIKNLTSICGDCQVEIPKILKERDVSCIVLDPARKGVSAQILNAVISAKPQKIVYISCEPASFVRDLNILLSSGLYDVKKIKPYDMFTNTSSVEVVCVITLKE